MYLTDLTDAQKEYIKGTILMDNWRSKYDFFLILDAIIYIDVSGCQWRLLPEEYPKWQTVYYYFRRWGAMDAFFIEEAKHDFGIDIEITHSNYSGQFVPAKKRWVVERTFAWLENFRRLCRNYEETTESANEMLMVAAVVISLRKLTSVNNRF